MPTSHLRQSRLRAVGDFSGVTQPVRGRDLALPGAKAIGFPTRVSCSEWMKPAAGMAVTVKSRVCQVLPLPPPGPVRDPGGGRGSPRLVTVTLV